MRTSSMNMENNRAKTKTAAHRKRRAATN